MFQNLERGKYTRNFENRTQSVLASTVASKRIPRKSEALTEEEQQRIHAPYAVERRETDLEIFKKLDSPSRPLLTQRTEKQIIKYFEIPQIKKNMQQRIKQRQGALTHRNTLQGQSAANATALASDDEGNAKASYHRPFFQLNQKLYNRRNSRNKRTRIMIFNQSEQTDLTESNDRPGTAPLTKK